MLLPLHVRHSYIPCSSRQSEAEIDHSFTALGITETWLNDANCKLYGMENYNLIEKHRENRSGGGVAVLLRKELLYSDRYDLNVMENAIETVFC